MKGSLLNFLRWLAVLLFSANAVPAAELVDLNSATLDAIARLPGVDIELARRIIEHRSYRFMAELSKAGLSSAQVEKLSAVATVRVASTPPVQNETPRGIGGRISQTGDPDRKIKVAVVAFDYGSVVNSADAIFGTNVDVGKGVAKILAERLAKDGRYTILETSNVDQLLAEQKFAASNIVRPSALAEFGRLLGADAMIVGDVTAFGGDDNKPPRAGSLGHFRMGQLPKPSNKAVVRLSARVIDVQTEEMVATADGIGESIRQGTSLTGGGGSAVNKRGVVDMSSSNFGSTIIGEATSASVTDLAFKLDGVATKLILHHPPIEGLVADVSKDNTLTVNVGAGDGLKVGDLLHVAHVVRTVTDPATGAFLRDVEAELGTVLITSVENRSSKGSYTGSPEVKVGDRVKKD